MTNSPPDRLFWDEYVSAETCFDKGDWEGCINEVKKNLDNSALPPFYLIKNCILIACALDKWDEADTYRATAEDAHNKALREAEESHDEDMIVMLGDLRSELDELEDFKREDIAMQTLDPQHLSQYWHADPNEDTSDYSQELQDEMQALVEVANELKEVVEAILLSNQVLMEAAGTQNPDQETHNDRHNELQRTLVRLRRRQAHLEAAVNREMAELQSQRRTG